MIEVAPVTELSKGVGAMRTNLWQQESAGGTAGLSWRTISCPGTAVIKLHELGPKQDVYSLS